MEIHVLPLHPQLNEVGVGGKKAKFFFLSP